MNDRRDPGVCRSWRGWRWHDCRTGKPVWDPWRLLRHWWWLRGWRD